MAHEISVRADGKAEMAYIGEVPWHRLGHALKAGASIDAWTKAAGFDWDILSAAPEFKFKGKMLPVENKRVLHRSDTGVPLGMVSKMYKPVQPAEVLGFFKRLTESEGFELETAGVLFGGAKLWALAKAGKPFKLGKEDEVRPYLLLATACDGTMQTQARYTSTRVVCNNTLSVAVHGKAEVLISHRQKFDAAEVHQQLGIVGDAHRELAAQAAKLAARKVSQAEAEAFIARLVQDAVFVIADDVKQVKESRPYKEIMRLFNGAGLGAGMATAKGTAWGLLNATTQYTDQLMRNKTPDHRMASALFGKGDAAKKLAYNGLVALV